MIERLRSLARYVEFKSIGSYDNPILNTRLTFCSPVFVLGAGVPQRLVFAVMGFFAIFNAYVMRVCLSIALTQMVIPSNKTASAASLDNTCPVFPEDHHNTVEHKQSGTYNWTVGQQVRVTGD